MKVKELQQKLSSLDPELDVICYTEDEALQKPGRAFVLLDVESVEATEAERIRLDDETPYLKIGKSPQSVTLVTLVVTTDF